MVDYPWVGDFCKVRLVKERTGKNKGCGARSGTDAERKGANMRRRMLSRLSANG